MIKNNTMRCKTRSAPLTFLFVFVAVTLNGNNLFVNALDIIPIYCEAFIDPSGNDGNNTLACPNAIAYVALAVGHALNQYALDQGLLNPDEPDKPYPDYNSSYILIPAPSNTSTTSTSGPTNAPFTRDLSTSPPTMIISTINPTIVPSSNAPTERPSLRPTQSRTTMPSNFPIVPGQFPTSQTPTNGQNQNIIPNQTSNQPTIPKPTTTSTLVPTMNPITPNPTPNPVMTLTANPTLIVTSNPTSLPTFAAKYVETTNPTNRPTSNPTAATSHPTTSPTLNPTTIATLSATLAPTEISTLNPTVTPTETSTLNPTATPTAPLTPAPTLDPTLKATDRLTPYPTSYPTAHPSINPTTTRHSPHPTNWPMPNPTNWPTASYPTSNPTTAPIPLPPVLNIVENPTQYPVTLNPTMAPTMPPTSGPSTLYPTNAPSTQSPTPNPASPNPSPYPTSNKVTSFPTNFPTTEIPTASPTNVIAPITPLLGRCDYDCDVDSDCQPGLLCSQEHRQELFSKGFSRKANCGWTGGMFDEVCFDANLISSPWRKLKGPNEDTLDSVSILDVKDYQDDTSVLAPTQAKFTKKAKSLVHNRRRRLCSCDPRCSSAKKGYYCMVLWCGRCVTKRVAVRNLSALKTSSPSQTIEKPQKKRVEMNGNGEAFPTKLLRSVDRFGEMQNLMKEKILSIVNYQPLSHVEQRRLYTSLANLAEEKLRELANSDEVSDPLCKKFLLQAKCSEQTR